MLFWVWLNQNRIYKTFWIWDLKGYIPIDSITQGCRNPPGFPKTKETGILGSTVFFVTISSISQLNQRHWLTWRRMVFLGRIHMETRLQSHLWGFQTRNSNSIAVNFPITTTFILRTGPSKGRMECLTTVTTGGDYELISLASSIFRICDEMGRYEEDIRDSSSYQTHAVYSNR
jgi:hypothetical protein